MPITVSPISSLLLPPLPSSSTSTISPTHDQKDGDDYDTTTTTTTAASNDNSEKITNPKAHHVGSPPTSFTNPWPSYNPALNSLSNVFRTRFSRDRPAFVPVPNSREELVGVREVDYELVGNSHGDSDPDGNAKVTWLGHASFLVQTSCPSPVSLALPGISAGDTTAAANAAPATPSINNIPLTRGINIFLDPVFSERTSPFTFLGPKRYTPTPCSMDKLSVHVPIDIVLISHNHYDHADAATLRYFHGVRGEDIVFVAGLGNARWLTRLGIPKNQIVEMDWWEQVEIEVEVGIHGCEYGHDGESMLYKDDDDNDGDATSTKKKARSNDTMTRVRITCTPSQHGSARGPFDRNCDLWCSYAIEDLSAGSCSPNTTTTTTKTTKNKKIFFAGDTGYRAVPTPSLSHAEEDALPTCPAFKTIGSLLGPFDLALLPIGLCAPRVFMSNVHANSWDSVRIHQDIKSKQSVGMHWGTVRGGLSQEYEDVRTPPRDWRVAGEEAGLEWRTRTKRRRLDKGKNEEGGWIERDFEGEEDEQKGWEIGLMDVGETLVLD